MKIPAYLQSTLLAAALALRGAAHQCSDRSRVQCTKVMTTAGAPSTHGLGYGAQGSPLCTPEGKKVYCIVDHDYHQCTDGMVPCCHDGSFPKHHGYHTPPEDSVTCSAATDVAPALSSAKSSDVVQIVLDDMDRSLDTTTMHADQGSFEPCMKDAYNGQFHHDWAQNKGLASFSFAFDPPKSGCYRIEEYHPGSDGTCSQYLPRNARLDVDYCKGLSATFHINQAEQAAQWNEVGRLVFFEGHKGRLTMRNAEEEECGVNPSGGCFWIADAFRLTLIGSPEVCAMEPELEDRHEHDKEHEVTEPKIAPEAVVLSSSLESQDGILLLRARLTDGTHDLQATLKANQDTISATLAAHIGRQAVEFMKWVPVHDRRLSQGPSATGVQIHFVARGSAAAVPGDLGQSLEAALSAAGASIQVTSANVEWSAPDTLVQKGEKEENGAEDHVLFSFWVILTVALTVLPLIGIGLCLLARRAAAKKKRTVVVGEGAKDVESAPEKAEGAAKEEVEGWEISSFSTDAPASESPVSELGEAASLDGHAPSAVSKQDSEADVGQLAL